MRSARLFVFCILPLSFAFPALSQTPSTTAAFTTASCGKPVCTWNTFGPETFARETGKPEGLTASFGIRNPNTHYTMVVQNNGVASAGIYLNGVQVFGPSDFNSNVAALQKSVSVLQGANTLSVELRSKPGANLTITVIGVDTDPPSIAYAEDPFPNQFGWNNSNVTLSFSCADQTSGVASCSNPFTLTTEGLNQTASGKAIDLAGNSTTVSVPVSIDKTPPTIVATSTPPPNSYNWNNSPVTVSFRCADNLSGVASCSPPVTVSSEGANQPVSGTAFDKAGNGATANVNLNIDETPPIVSIVSPANGSAVSAAELQINGSVFDTLSGVAAVTCNGSPAVLTSSSFSCKVILASGGNSVQVRATDVAGNGASTQVSVTFNPVPVVPPKAIFITPTLASLIVGRSRTIKLVGDIGQNVTGATWTVSDPTVVSITQSDPPQLVGVAPGIATLAASFNGLSASMTVNVFSGTALPVGTPIWSIDPMPGNFIFQMVRGNPVNPGDPDIFALESPNSLRAFTADGRQLWTTKVTRPPQAIGSPTSVDLQRTAQEELSTPATATNTIPLPEPILRKLKSVMVPGPLQQLLQLHPQLARKIPALAEAARTSSAAPLAADAATAIAERDFLEQSIPDNNGGTIDVVLRLPFSSPFQTTLARVDNATQQVTWSYDSPGIVTGLAISPDNTVYGTEVVVVGPRQGCCFDPTHSDVLALDGATGQQKFKLPIPAGHVAVVPTNINADNNARLGLPSILPDGSLNLLVYTVHITETLAGCINTFGTCETAVSDHKTLQLLTVQPDGSFSTRDIQHFDFDQSGCGLLVGGCQDPGQTDFTDLTNEFPNAAQFQAGEIIPDGQGAALVAWSGGGTIGTTPVLGPFQARVRRFDASGSTSDYTVPLASSDWSSPNFNRIPRTLILGENNVAFGSDGQSAVAFDVTTGAQKWTFQPGDDLTGVTLLNSRADGGATGYTADRNSGIADALLTFDPGGAPASFPVTGNIDNLSFFDPATLLATTTTGQALLAAALDLQPSEGIWFTEAGDLTQRRPVPPTILSLSTSRAPAGIKPFGVLLKGSGLTQVASIDAGTGITVQMDPGAVLNDKLGTMFTVAASATPGVHKLTATLKNGQKITSQVDFFVQVPASLELHLGERVQYTGNHLITPDGDDLGPAFGYSRTGTYQLLDQDTPTKPIENGNYIAQEVFTPVSSNPAGIVDNNGNNGLNADGVFLDFLAFFAGGAPGPQPGQFKKEKQAWTIMDNNTGKAYKNVRVNCLDFESNEVTVTDITNGGSCQ